MLQKALEGFGRLWEALGRLWEALKYFRMLWVFWEALAATVKICQALHGLEGFGGFRNAFGGFGKL